MKKIILSIIVTGLFMINATGVSAMGVAGSSAQLAFLSLNDKKDIQDVSVYKKKLAIKAVLEKYDSPMIDEVDSFIDTCVKYDLDCYLLPAIAGVESTFGRFIYPGSNNPFGWGRGLIMFKNWSEAIDTVGAGLKNNYIDRGARTVDQIGRIYCEGNTWSGKVQSIMRQFKAEEEKISLFSKEFPVQL